MRVPNFVTGQHQDADPMSKATSSLTFPSSARKARTVPHRPMLTGDALDIDAENDVEDSEMELVEEEELLSSTSLGREAIRAKFRDEEALQALAKWSAEGPLASVTDEMVLSADRKHWAAREAHYTWYIGDVLRGWEEATGKTAALRAYHELKEKMRKIKAAEAEARQDAAASKNKTADGGDAVMANACSEQLRRQLAANSRMVSAQTAPLLPNGVHAGRYLGGAELSPDDRGRQLGQGRFDFEHFLRPREAGVVATVKPRMLTVLYGWINNCLWKLQLSDDTYFAAVALGNAFFKRRPNTPIDSLQLFGCACTWIATKYNDVRPLCAVDLTWMSHDVFTKEQLCQAEIEVLRDIGYLVGKPTVYSFARRYLEVAEEAMPTGTTEKMVKRMRNLCLYALERASLESTAFAHIGPSKMAAAAVLMALNCVGHVWSPEVRAITGATKTQLKNLSRKLRSIVVRFDDERHKTVIEKYGKKERGSVSVLRSKKKTEVTCG